MGVVQTAHPLTEEARIRGGTLRVFLILVPPGLFLAALAGFFLTDRALRPVRRVTQAAALIGAEDLSRRLPVSGEDEMAELAATFNAMIGRLEEAFQQLKQSCEQQQRFTSDASHELRTPLTTIKANTSLALLGDRSVRDYRDTIQVVDQAADVMSRIVQDLLLLARSDAGQLTVESAIVRVGSVLRQAIHAAARPDSAPVGLELTDERLEVSGDAHHLVRLFTNLLENATRHTPADGLIRLSASHGAESVVIRVADSGEGISAEHLPHVCERFYRVDPARTHARGGAGLGLAICRSIAEAHSGSLVVDSIVGAGTAVTVTLPRAQATVEQSCKPPD